MNNIKVWFPDEQTEPDYPFITISRAIEINPEADWKIGIWRPRGGIGDMLMLTPTFEAIKKKLPNSKITVITTKSYLSGVLFDILYGNPFIDEIVDFDSFKEINKLDILVNEANACVDVEVPGAFPPNRIDIFANTAGVHITDEKVFYKIKKDELHNAEKFILSRRLDLRKPVILYQPFASSEQRSMEVLQSKNLLAVMRDEFANSAILIPTHSTDWAGDVDFSLLGCEQLINYNIRLLAAIIYSAVDIVVCPDSSLLHLAGALDKPTVALFGPTPSSSRVNHYPKAVGIDFGKKVCKKRWPCWYSPCPFGKLCWKTVEESVIIDTMQCVLKGDFPSDSQTGVRSEII